jgi:chromate transporter
MSVMKPTDVLPAIFLQFAMLSMLAFGGANSVVPEMHRQAVEVRHWMSDKEFAALFAIAQAAPGPNFMISTLVGWKAAGVVGAIVATIAMAAPSCLFAYWVAKVWDRHRAAVWRIALASGLAPVTVGLVASSAWLLSRAADSDVRLTVVTVATGVSAYATKLNPLWLLAVAGALGFSGFV